ncbi:hypothetical protein TK34_05415 [Aeromonas hydrophila]|nr:hypothetical protein TK34_05415 [Aeromonas hydrophila]
MILSKLNRIFPVFNIKIFQPRSIKFFYMNLVLQPLDSFIYLEVIFVFTFVENDIFCIIENCFCYFTEICAK